MRSMKRLCIGLGLTLLWTSAASPILASESGTVAAQVTVATPCVLVSPETLDFGTLPFSNEITVNQASTTHADMAAEAPLDIPRESCSSSTRIYTFNISSFAQPFQC